MCAQVIPPKISVNSKMYFNLKIFKVSIFSRQVVNSFSKLRTGPCSQPFVFELAHLLLQPFHAVPEPARLSSLLGVFGGAEQCLPALSSSLVDGPLSWHRAKYVRPGQRNDIITVR